MSHKLEDLVRLTRIRALLANCHNLLLLLFVPPFLLSPTIISPPTQFTGQVAAVSRVFYPLSRRGYNSDK